ncbi:hypothetical protein BH20ACT13_BH20ACT13_15710 [soil metagenome]
MQRTTSLDHRPAELESAARTHDERARQLSDIEQRATRSEPYEYLLVVPVAVGYTLVEQVGTLPGRGTSVTLSEAGAFEVLRFGASPLPHDGRPCAYLLRAA